MKITVHLFARARDLAGAESVVVDLGPGAAVADLRRRLGETCPALVSILRHSALAVNNEYAGDDVPLPAEAEVALLPPVSGG
jgi:molybdopterin converting factor small subunit